MNYTILGRTGLKVSVAGLGSGGHSRLGQAAGRIEKESIALDPLSFLIQKGKASTLPEAAYRFCSHEPGVHVVLTGTGNPVHLKANVEALSKPPLPKGDLQHLQEIFGTVDSVTGG